MKTAEELFELTGPVLDAMHIKARPIVSMDALKNFFEAQEKMTK